MRLFIVVSCFSSFSFNLNSHENYEKRSQVENRKITFQHFFIIFTWSKSQLHISPIHFDFDILSLAELAGTVSLLRTQNMASLTTSSPYLGGYSVQQVSERSWVRPLLGGSKFFFFFGWRVLLRVLSTLFSRFWCFVLVFLFLSFEHFVFEFWPIPLILALLVIPFQALGTFSLTGYPFWTALLTIVYLY